MKNLKKSTKAKRPMPAMKPAMKVKTGVKAGGGSGDADLPSDSFIEQENGPDVF